jgi:hypothetical protein
MRTEELILSIAKSLIYRESINRYEFVPSDWFRVKEYLIYHELGPIAYCLFEQQSNALSAEIFELLKNCYEFCLRRNQCLWQEFINLHNCFEQEGVLVVPIKGIALLKDVYDSFLRPMADIDLLVKEEDYRRAEEIMQNQGYKKILYGRREGYWRNKQCHIAFKKEDILCDLHWQLDFKQRQSQLPLLFRRLRRISLDNVALTWLSPEDTFFSLVLHQRRFGKMLCLKSVLDIALLLKKYCLDFDWDYVLTETGRGRMCSSVYFCLAQIQLLLGFSLPKEIKRFFKSNLPGYKRFLIKRLIKNYTFPKKGFSIKQLYLKTHFLLYDSLWESIDYILHIPLEQFASFYGLSPYERKTQVFYQNRFFYILYNKCLSFFKKIIRKKIEISLNIDDGLNPKLHYILKGTYPLTPLKALELIAKVKTQPWYGGRIVISINGTKNNCLRHWKYLVNKKEASELANRFMLSSGDCVEWAYTKEG